MQDVIYRLYRHSRSHEESLTEVNRLFTKNDTRDDKAIGDDKAKSKSRGRKTLDFLGNSDETFISIARTLKHEIFVIVDAIDECVDRLEAELFAALHSWVQDPEAKVKVLLSSRPEPEIMKNLENYPLIDIAQCNSPDIVRLTDAALSSSIDFTPSERRRIRAAMIEKAQGQFTYIDLAIKILEQPWIRPVDNVLAKFQDGVDRLYQETLKSTDANYKDLALKVLTWTLLSQDQLPVSDFYDIYSRRYTAESSQSTAAKELGKEETSLELSAPPATDANTKLYGRRILEAARTFIRITGTDILVHQHQNVRDCFLKERPNTQEAQQYFYICAEQGHLAITLELLRALNSDSFSEHYMPLEVSPRLQ